LAYGTIARKMTERERPPPPAALYLRTPNGQHRLAGEYRLVEGKTAGEQPIWRREGRGEVGWLYSGILGKWHVSVNPLVVEKDFKCARGHIATARKHLGKLPHEIETTNWWAYKGGMGPTGWIDDQKIVFSTCLPEIPPELYVTSLNGQQRMAGTYLRDGYANGNPLWKRAGLGEEAWLYTGTTGKWCISNHKAEEQDFACSFCQISCDRPHGGVQPHLWSEGCWEYHCGEDSHTDPEILIETTSPEPPPVLYLTSPVERLRVVGRYDLVVGEYVNGQPYWKRSGFGQEAWLYTNVQGKWCVGGRKAQELNFRCSKCYVSTSRPHGGILPHVFEEDVWEVHDSKSSEIPTAQNAVLIHDSFPVPPSSLHILSRGVHQDKTGEFQLVENQYANGMPVWKRVGLGEEMWLYSGTSSKWYVCCKAASKKEFDCNIGDLASTDRHGGALPHRMDDNVSPLITSRTGTAKTSGWGYRDAQYWTPDPLISVSCRAPDRPAVIHVLSPKYHQKVSGEYWMLEGRYANGQPLYKRAGLGEEAWLYSGINGKLHVSCSAVVQKQFACNLGQLVSADFHGGVLDSVLDGCLWCGCLSSAGAASEVSAAWRADSGIKALASSSNPPPTYHLTTPNGQQRFGGDYCLVEGQYANGMPVWKRANSKEGAWIYSGVNGKWYATCSPVLEKAFECSLGSVASSQPHGGLLPHQYTAGDWNFKTENGWESDSEITFESEPQEVPEVLHVASADREDKMAGAYALLEGQYEKGQPVWKKQARGQEAYLYTGIDGSWCVSSRPMQAKQLKAPAHVASERPHGGVLPHLFSKGGWGIRQPDSTWHAEPELKVLAEPVAPAILHVSSPKGGDLNGKYYRMKGQTAYNQPVWKKDGSKEGAVLCTGADGKWYLKAGKCSSTQTSGVVEEELSAWEEDLLPSSPVMSTPGGPRGLTKAKSAGTLPEAMRGSGHLASAKSSATLLPQLVSRTGEDALAGQTPSIVSVSSLQGGSYLTGQYSFVEDPGDDQHFVWKRLSFST